MSYEPARTHPIKVIPLVIATALSLWLPFGMWARIAIALAVYLLLFFITWRRKDGRRVFPGWVW